MSINKMVQLDSQDLTILRVLMEQASYALELSAITTGGSTEEIDRRLVGMKARGFIIKTDEIELDGKNWDIYVLSIPGRIMFVQLSTPTR